MPMIALDPPNGYARGYVVLILLRRNGGLGLKCFLWIYSLQAEALRAEPKQSNFTLLFTLNHCGSLGCAAEEGEMKLLPTSDPVPGTQ